MFSTAELEDRKPLFKWVSDLAVAEYVLLGRKDDKPLASIDDARSLKIGVYLGDGFGKSLGDMGLKMDTAVHDDLNPAKLAAKRIDAWAVNFRRGRWLAKQQNVDVTVVL